MSTLRILMAIVAAVVVAASFADQTAAQGDCTSSLAPCLPYLNATTGKTPPATCCKPLKNAVATQKGCICNLFNTPGLLESLGSNTTQVVDLAKSCDVDADPTTLCTASAPSPASGTTTPAAPPPPGNGATPGRMMDIGLASLVLVLVSSILLH